MIDLQRARSAVDAAFVAHEEAVVRERLTQTGLDDSTRARISAQAANIVRALRADSGAELMESFLAEYGLSSDEGVALMCLAEAYLRVPDAPTLDALIRDKIGGTDWARHGGDAESLLINASTWALMLTGKIYRDGEPAEAHLVSSLRRMVRRVGEPVVRTAVAQAMRVMGQQFVLGRDIDAAMTRAKAMMVRGYHYSFDMLGEAARTDPDARRYFRSYSNAIAILSRHAEHDFVHDNPGISVKLSALHPRYEAVHRDRILSELVPRLSALVEQARNANIGLSIDAEESDRLGLSLDVIEAVMRNADLAGWDGFGVVVQAYSKQCLAVLQWLHALASALDRRIAVRLVKGAYWDMEIKQAQTLGLAGYPVFTRKASTDVAYLAAARFLLDSRDRLYPQFATHNAHTAAAVLEMADVAKLSANAAQNGSGSGKKDDDSFELQRLHGMGEALHDAFMQRFSNRCRIYAPVGVHEDLLAYLVRRLLENGANSSFVHQLRDEDVAVEILVRDPLTATLNAGSVVHSQIPLPSDLLGAQRRNSRGWNINNPLDAREIDDGIAAFRENRWLARPMIARHSGSAPAVLVTNPANRDDIVGSVHGADVSMVKQALDIACDAFGQWNARTVDERATVLDAIADHYEANTFELLALLCREAGKTRLDGVLELREAVDFCRYYAAQARHTFAGNGLGESADRGHEPKSESGAGRKNIDDARVGRGVFVCISPWNFPLAIFTGQIVAALVTGNTVIAKPAEQTALIAARAVQLMHDAGVPQEVLCLLPGDGAVVGAALCAEPRVAGVCFTGSTQTAQSIDRAMAGPGNAMAPLIAETGGLNAMIVDSTALPEAAVRDIVNSAFQSAGQRCSALRVLFVQKDIKAKLLTMLEGAAMALEIGDPWRASVDVGPVIDDEAHAAITAHCEHFAQRGRVLFAHPMTDAESHGRFVAPTAIALEEFNELQHEVFGPVLHVLEFDGTHLESVVAQINDSGYGLTFGMHSRLDDRVQSICGRIKAGNIYVNRNQIGAVVGVQPFGGEGLSGTGPKAGGPHYLRRFTCAAKASAPPASPAQTFTPAPAVPDSVTDAVAVAALRTLTPQLLADAYEHIRARWDARSDRVALLEFAARRLPAASASQVLRTLVEARALFGPALTLPGPTGESNYLSLHGRGIALCLGDDVCGVSGDGGTSDAGKLQVLAMQTFAALAAGNAVALIDGDDARHIVAVLAAAGLERELAGLVDCRGLHNDHQHNGEQGGAVALETLLHEFPQLALVVFDGEVRAATPIRRALAGRDGRRVMLLSVADDMQMFATERVVSIDTTASGGNATLLTLDEG